MTKHLQVGPGGARCACCCPRRGSAARRRLFRAAKRREAREAFRAEALNQEDE